MSPLSWALNVCCFCGHVSKYLFHGSSTRLWCSRTSGDGTRQEPRSWKCTPGSWPDVKISGTVPCGTVHLHLTVLCENLLFVSQRITNDWETMFLVTLFVGIAAIYKSCWKSVVFVWLPFKVWFLRKRVLLGNRSTLIRACWCLFTLCSVGKLW